MKHSEYTNKDTKETHVRYARKIRIELRDELDKWLEKRQAMLVLGIEEESVPSTSEQSRKDGERIKRLQEENERLGVELIQVKEDAVAYHKSAKTRGNDEDPSLVKQAVEVATKNCKEENIAMRKKVAELEAQIKAKSVSADERQVKMLSEAAIKADEEIARLKAEIVRKDHWFEHTPMEEKAKNGWVMYFQLKKGMAKGGEFDQEAAS